MRKRINFGIVMALVLALVAGCSSGGSEQNQENKGNVTNNKPVEATRAPKEDEEGFTDVKTPIDEKDSQNREETPEVQTPAEEPGPTETPVPTEIPANLVAVPVEIITGVEGLEYYIGDNGCLYVSRVKDNVTHLYIPAEIDGIPVARVDIKHSTVKVVVLDENMARDAAVELTGCPDLEVIYLTEYTKNVWVTDCPKAVYYVKENSYAEQYKIQAKESWAPELQLAYYAEVPDWVDSVRYQSGIVDNQVGEPEEFTPADLTSLEVTPASALEYKLDSRGWIKICGIKDRNLEHLVIPAEIDGYPVVEIMDTSNINIGSFEGRTRLKSVIIPETVTYIGERAFTGCSNLEAVVIKGNLEKLGDECFKDCDNLKSVVFEGQVKCLGSASFSGCWELRYINLPEGLIEIGTAAFQGCTRLSEIIIPESVEIIGGSAFKDCKSLQELKFPDKLTKLSASVCNGCSWLEKVTLPKQLESIGSLAFAYCYNLKEFEVPEGIKILDAVFNNCIQLRHCTLPASLEKISTEEFSETWSLLDISAPEGSYAANWAKENGFRVNAKPEEKNENVSGAAPKEVWNYVDAVDTVTYRDITLSEADFITAEDYENFVEMGLENSTFKLGVGEDYTISAKTELRIYGRTTLGDEFTYSNERYEYSQAGFGHYYIVYIMDYYTDLVCKITFSFPQALNDEARSDYIDTVSKSIQANLE